MNASDKPIARKLMLREGRSVLLVNAPGGYKKTPGPLPTNVRILKTGGGPADMMQIFVTSRREME